MPEKCPDTCPLAPRMEALERANEQHGSTHREMYSRLNTLERGESAQAEQYKAILTKLDDLTSSHRELNKRLSDLESKPGRRWDSVVDKVLLVLVGTVAGYILFRLGLSV